MQVNVESNDHLCRMMLVGELNADKANMMKSQALQMLSDERTLEIDLSGVRSFDMAGLHVTIDIRRHAEFLRASVRFTADNFAAREIVDLHERIWTLVAPTHQQWALAA